MALVIGAALVGWRITIGATIAVTTTNDVVDGTTTNISALLANPGPDGLISLREAVLACNGTSGTDIITLPAGNYVLTLGQLQTTQALTINGAGATSTIIDANQASRILNVATTGRLTLTNLTLRNGRVTSGGGGAVSKTTGATTFTNVRLLNNAAPNGNGGAVLSTGGTLNWTDVTAEDNVAQNGGAVYASAGTLSYTRPAFRRNTAQNGEGGAIWLAGARVVLNTGRFENNVANGGNGGAVRASTTSNSASSVTLGIFSGNSAPNGNGGVLATAGNNGWTMNDNLFSGNTAGQSGGAVFVGSGGNVNISRNTYDANRAVNGSGGAIAVAHAGTQTTTMTNATLHANRAGNGGGASVASGTLSLVNATVARNTSDNGAANLLHTGGTLRALNTLVASDSALTTNCSGTITSVNSNLDTGNTCGFSQATDRRNATAALGTFGSNGGNTPTLSILLASQAVNAGTASGAPTNDQRGLGRQGAHDIGSFEFGAGTTGFAISGRVFEDVNFGGGSGRNHGTALAEGGAGAGGARVELYDSSGSYVRSTDTAADGSYSFTFLPSGTYTVRVVNETVVSSRSGWTAEMVPVQTFRADAPAGTVVEVTDRVGGQIPARIDADFGSTTLASLTSPGVTAQSVSVVQLGAANIANIDFGFSFNVVVNTNDAGQGSLRQFLIHSNGLAKTGLAIAGRSPVGLDHAVFMLPDGTARPGTTASYASAFSGGIASIALSDSLEVQDPAVIDARTQPGWSSAPLIELNGSSVPAGSEALTIDSGSTVRGFVINRARGAGIVVVGSGNTLQGNWIGLNSAGTSASANAGGGVQVLAGSNTIGGAGTLRNVIAGNTSDGLQVSGASATENVIVGNLIGRNATDTATVANTRHGVYLRGQASRNTVGGLAAGEGNVIRGNASHGVVVEDAGAVRNAILGNSIADNAGQGIRLALASGSITTADGAKPSTHPNLGMDPPVITSASAGPGVVSLAGHVGNAPGLALFGGARVEFFVADTAGAGPGEGQTYLGTTTTDASGNFAVTLSVPGGVTVTAGATRITATATDVDGNTSEFSANALAGVEIGGTVFEDPNYGGGAGRSLTASGGVAVAGARVELFNASGAFVTATTTASDGTYRFVGVAPGTAHVRVVSSTVASSRPGWVAGLLPVPTYRTSFDGSVASASTDRVGGTNPAVADAAAAASGSTLSTVTYVFSAGPAGTAQAVAPVTVAGTSATGIDFGFNFSTVVNVNNSGQGSLRQFLLNAAALGNKTSLAQAGTRRLAGATMALPGAVEHAIFMIPNGTAVPGLRAGLTNQLTAGGWARITLGSALPALAAGVVVDGASQTANVGDTNAGQVGTGGTVGVSGTVLPRFDRPEVELSGGFAVTVGGAGGALRAVALRSGTVNLAAANTEVSDTLVAMGADGASDATTSTAAAHGINLPAAAGVVVRHNFVRVDNTGIRRDSAGGSALIELNEVQAPATGHGTTFDGVILATGTNDLVRFNRIAGQRGAGIEVPWGGGQNLVYEENTIIGNGLSGSTASSEPGGVVIYNSTSTTGPQITLRRNVITGNGGPGIHVGAASGVLITQNSIFGNGAGGVTGLGIDLDPLGRDGNGTNPPHGVTANTGVRNASLPNSGMNHPVITSASLAGSTLAVSGYVGLGAGSADFGATTVEVFVSDANATGFGSGQTYLGQVVADASGAFTGTVTVPAGVTLTPGATQLTATARDAQGSTSEFGPNLVYGFGIAGTVFEDVNYGGGPGRSLAASGGVRRPGARVELYTVSGSTATFARASSTGASGTYEFASLAPGNYLVRVVSATVGTSRSGATAGLLPVVTFMTEAGTGTVTPVTNSVGGNNPSNTQFAAATGAPGDTSPIPVPTAEATALVTLGSAPANGLDFGFNFNTVTNTNDDGQGSLRQAIVNANALGGDATLAQDRRAPGIEHVVFMIPNGTTGGGGSLSLPAGGLRSDLNAFTTSAGGRGVATIPAQSGYSITSRLVVDAQTQPGWTLEPRLEIRGDSAGSTDGLINLSGGSVTLRGFVLNRFAGEGVMATGNADGHVLQGNWVGVDAAGSARAAIGFSAIWLSGTGNNHVVGGTEPSQRNVLSGTTRWEGLAIQAGSGHLIQGNYIGTDSTGSTAISTTSNGIKLYPSVSNSIVGGAAAGAGNVVSGSLTDGVLIQGSAITVQGNRIGTNASGSAAMANARSGVRVEGTGNIIGGTGAGEGNLISGNTESGLRLTGAAATLVQGNRVGTTADGSAALSNGSHGIFVEGGASLTGVQIGGSAAGAGNQVVATARCCSVGIRVEGTTGIIVRGNRIGTDTTGAARLAGGWDGIALYNTMNARIGGAGAAEGNTIVAAGASGIAVFAGNQGLVMQGNFIGTNAASATGLGSTYGVWFESGGGAAGHTVGGTSPGTGNVIAHNTSNGLIVWDGTSGVSVLGNRFFSNGGLGIDLNAASSSTATTTLNDGAVSPGRPNLLMDHPVFTSARARGNQLSVAGYVGSAPGQTVFANARVELFESDSDSSGFGEGRTYLGFVTTDANGNFSGTVTMTQAVLRVGTRLTGTATDAAGNTSEFGANFDGLVVDFVVNHNGDAVDANPGDGVCETATPGQCTLRAAIAEFNAQAAQSGGTPTVAFALPGCTAATQSACRIAPASGLPAIGRAMHVDARTQPGWTSTPLVVLGGASAGSVNGLTVSASGASLRGFVVNGFNGAGVLVSSGVTGTLVEGNWLGLDATGTAAAGNTQGLIASGSTNTTLRANVISGNANNGITASGATTTGLVIVGNTLGLNAAGVAAVPNAFSGVALVGVVNARIGGTTAGDRNIVSGNSQQGIWLNANSGATIQGNWIGLAADGLTVRGNGQAGIELNTGTASTTIGGSGAGEANVIAGNGQQGIRLAANAGQRNRINGNAIYGNTLLGIDLGTDGVTANDGQFLGSRPNAGIDHPVIGGAGLSGNQLTVFGRVGTGTGQAVFAGSRIEFFRAAPDPLGFGEGQVFLGALTADAEGRFSGTVALPAGALSIGDPITATATDPNGNTSEFGPNWVTTTAAALAPSRFNAFETSTLLGALTGSIRTMTAGLPTSLSFIAIDTSGTGLATSFSGSVTVEWMDARAGGVPDASGCSASWTVVGPAATIAFTAGLPRLAASITPPDAGRDWRLRFTHTTAGGQTVRSCSTDNFAVKPATLAVTSLGSQDSTSAGIGGVARSLANGTVNGGVVHRAGRPFALRAQALASGGALTAGYDGTAQLAIASCALPATGCVTGALQHNGAAPVLTAAAGVLASDTMTYSEVGAIRIRLTDTSFADVDAADSTLAERTIASGDILVGRFVPDRFDVSIAQAGVLGTANAACTLSGAGYTFFGQAFGWSAAPQATVTARNAQGATTLNWTGSLQKLDPVAHAAQTVSVTAPAGAALAQSHAAMTRTDLGAGVARLAAQSPAVFSLARGTTPVASSSPALSWALAVTDASEAAVAGNGTVSGNATQAGLAFDQGNVFHHGRLALAPGHGDARSGVRLMLELQRFNGNGWVTMTEDRGCITVAPQQFAVSNAQGVFTTAGVCAAPPMAGATTRGGRAWVPLPGTPGQAPGRLTVGLGLGTVATGQACAGIGSIAPALPLNLPHLGVDPAAVLTWGRPNRDVVLTRERF